ncbi:DNA helicase IV [Vibrio maerlii]|uniref:DNA helicase IV n=1 Tax=Vibrio maerlii TaxID=2231648 RepID=UPI000E3C727E|nr:DNA helicase IV [Vibrio maerlii]
MDVCASRSARFFTQNAYHDLSVEDDTLVVSSESSEERIPFSIWNGELELERGLVWDSLVVWAHPKQDKQMAWKVQGLPKSESKRFAHQIVSQYQAWHERQCETLNAYLPTWERELHRLVQLQSFLPYSSVSGWVQQVTSDFETMSISLEEASHWMPNRMEVISNWLLDCDLALSNRNLKWLETERHNWSVLFSQVESSALNRSQQEAVLLNNDHNLILAGAGTGKTSVLMARVAYLLQSHQAQGEQILLLAFGRKAAEEMRVRLKEKFGLAAERVTVATFHQLGLKIIREVEGANVEISRIATDENQKKAWCIDWLKKHWMTPTNFKRWQKHLSQWPIAYITGDDELGSNAENPKLIAWLASQLDILNSLGMNKKSVQQEIVDHQDYPRLNSELSLVWPCYQAWLQMLKESNQLDFPAMIAKASNYVAKSKFKSGWKFIMVDEYQDISPDRLELIEGLCNLETAEGKPSLFAVGDDWQSIYQFAGSDVDLTTGFAARFPHSSSHSLQTTYRFNNQIGAVANQFVQQNPSQIKKNLESHKEQKKKAVTLLPNNKLEVQLEKLNNERNRGAKVLLLGRNHYHKPESFDEWKTAFDLIEIEFMTCHASKGREADFVFVLSVDDGQFPARERQVHLDNALLSSGEGYEHAEERRLFYVAMTRAKKHVWVCFGAAPSVFVTELQSSQYPTIKG